MFCIKLFFDHREKLLMKQVYPFPYILYISFIFRVIIHDNFHDSPQSSNKNSQLNQESCASNKFQYMIISWLQNLKL